MQDGWNNAYFISIAMNKLKNICATRGTVNINHVYTLECNEMVEVWIVPFGLQLEGKLILKFCPHMKCFLCLWNLPQQKECYFTLGSSNLLVRYIQLMLYIVMAMKNTFHLVVWHRMLCLTMYSRGRQTFWGRGWMTFPQTVGGPNPHCPYPCWH